MTSTNGYLAPQMAPLRPMPFDGQPPQKRPMIQTSISTPTLSHPNHSFSYQSFPPSSSLAAVTGASAMSNTLNATTPGPSNTMPPPASTASLQKPTDPSEFMDVLNSSGVDLRQEEQLLAESISQHRFRLHLSQTAQMEEASLRNQAQLRARQGTNIFRGNNRLDRKFTQAEQRSIRIPHREDLKALLNMALRDSLDTLSKKAILYARSRLNTYGSGQEGTGLWEPLAAPIDSNSGLSVNRGDVSAVSPRTMNPLKRNFDAVDGRRPTHQFTNEAAKSLRTLASADKSRQDVYIARTALLRNMGASNGTPVGDSATTPGAGGSGSGTPVPGSIAPEPLAGTMIVTGGGGKKMTVKESRKAQAARDNEALQHRNANATASMMLGGKKKKYSWMLGGGPGAPTPGTPSTPADAGHTPSISSPLPGTPSAAPTANPIVTNSWVGKRWGEYNELAEAGSGPKELGLRDFARALDDGVHYKSLQRAYARQDQKDRKAATGMPLRIGAVP